MHADFSPVEHANFVAARVVGHATAYLDGRNDADTLYICARSVCCDLMMVSEDLRAKAILDATRLLTIAMLNASSTKDAARLDRWQQVMGSLVDLVKMESTDLRKSGAQRS